MSDADFARRKYYENSGLKLNLDNPSGFNEKIWWLKLNNRDPLLTFVSDKVTARNFVKEKINEDILIPILGIYNSVEDVPFDRFKQKVIIKTNKGSGENRLWIPGVTKKKSIINYFNKVIDKNYYYESREWNYKDIEPKIIVENFIETKNQFGLIDYRFFCFEGKVEFVAVDLDTMADDGSHYFGATRNIYDKNFNHLDEIKISRNCFNSDLVVKPHNFDIMINYAEILSKPFVFCRVDLYNVDGKIYFGEVTFYPGGGTQIITPTKYEKKYGDLININSDKIVLDGK
jgi:hypothetical protein